jgi:hypothetical protein
MINNDDIDNNYTNDDKYLPTGSKETPFTKDIWPVRTFDDNDGDCNDDDCNDDINNYGCNDDNDTDNNNNPNDHNDHYNNGNGDNKKNNDNNIHINPIRTLDGDNNVDGHLPPPPVLAACICCLQSHTMILLSIEPEPKKIIICLQSRILRSFKGNACSKKYVQKRFLSSNHHGLPKIPLGDQSRSKTSMT